MKVNKVLKRLAKIEELMSEVTERCSKSAPDVREALQDAAAAFARVKAVVNSQTPSKTAAGPPAERAKSTVKKKAPVKKAVAKSVVATGAPTVVKKTRGFSAAQKTRQAERIKTLWATKRKAQPKVQKKTASKPKKTISLAIETPAPAKAEAREAAQ